MALPDNPLPLIAVAPVPGAMAMRLLSRKATSVCRVEDFHARGLDCQLAHRKTLRQF